MSCSLFTFQNFLDPNTINEATASSEKTAFPSSNLYDRQQRSKVWRSDGYYVLDATNNVVIFRETDGVDLTATVAEGSYDTAGLAAAVKTALDTAGASTYTVSQDSTTLKYVIASNGAGGDGRLELNWSDPLSTIADVLGFSVSSDDTGFLTYTADFINLHSEEWLLWDFGLPSLPESLFVFGDRNDTIKLAPTDTIELQASMTDNFTSAPYTATVPYDGRTLQLFDVNGLGTTPYRYWRLRLVSPENSNGYIQLGYVHLGSLLKPTRGRVTFGFGAGYDDFSNSVRALGGQVFSNLRAKTQTFQVSWEKLTKDDRDLFEDHFNNRGLSLPFIAVFDNGTVLSNDQPRFTRLVKYAETPSYQLVSPNNYTITMTLQEAL